LYFSAFSVVLPLKLTTEAQKKWKKELCRQILSSKHMTVRTKTRLGAISKIVAIGLATVFSIACQTIDLRSSGADSIETMKEIQASVSPTPDEAFNIHSKIGIADVRDDGIGCLRTKNKDLAEKSAVSIILSLEEPPQRILNATIEKKLGKSCARRASESGDQNPGDNIFYSLIINDDGGEKFGFDNGIAVIRPEKQIQLLDGLAVLDLNDDGKLEYFRRCGGYEGTHFTVWTGKPIQGKRIWHSFYYVDYDTEPTCKDKEWK
jgi:hypothetical protein